MSVLLPSPSPPQIMLLIINRMRACSSWKAGTGTSLLNGAAQLGLKLFNRNTKAPSVQRTRPSEVTACCPSPASTPVPPAPLHPCPAGGTPAAPPALLTTFSQPSPFLPATRVCFSVDPKPKPNFSSLSVSLRPQTFPLQPSSPLSWDALFLSALQSPSLLHAVALVAPLVPRGRQS